MYNRLKIGEGPGIQMKNDINMFSQKSRNSVRRLRSSRWQPPPAGWLKCNFDCSFSTNNEFAGIGWIVRDEKGSFITAGSAKIRGVKSSLDGEAHTFLYALQNIWIKRWKQVWFEGDSMALTSLINTSGNNMELGNLLVDIRH